MGPQASFGFSMDRSHQRTARPPNRNPSPPQREVCEMVKATEKVTVEEVSYPTLKVEQNGKTIYVLTIPTEDLAPWCYVPTREGDPDGGFQRTCDAKRASEIAEYVSDGEGIIPTSLTLSAKPEAQLTYDRKNKSISFRRLPGKSFAVLDGQHRLEGFKIAQSAGHKMRVIVSICGELPAAFEAKLFVDVNTKAKPVPPSLLLDVKQLAACESAREAVLRDLYDQFNTDRASPLAGKMSPTGSDRTKLSRVTFN